ncbi:MAG TPA: hypothetical protein DCE42_21915 [Myxococcales bacterium]|nr:hypothetical protein [Deltaproteobacteria bacterium]MBU54405.1 hypothetical protein [Deltaproteobacteria bacterium]HAA57437.1 hypothetical protein [Myxococcales bacterium]
MIHCGLAVHTCSGSQTPNPTMLTHCLCCAFGAWKSICSTVAKRRSRVNTKDTPQTQPPNQYRIPIKKNKPLRHAKSTQKTYISREGYHQPLNDKVGTQTM